MVTLEGFFGIQRVVVLCRGCLRYGRRSRRFLGIDGHEVRERDCSDDAKRILLESGGGNVGDLNILPLLGTCLSAGGGGNGVS